MDLTFDEIRILLGMCVRGLHDIRDSERLDLNHTDVMELNGISEKIEEAYDHLSPWAPDVEDLNGQ